GGPNFVEFKTAAPVNVKRVELFIRADNRMPGGPRSVDKFTLTADTDADGTFETVLVDHQSPKNDTSASTYDFQAVTASAFRAEFTSGATAQDPRGGPRIVELDAMGPAVQGGPAVVTIYDERIA